MSGKIATFIAAQLLAIYLVLFQVWSSQDSANEAAQLDHARALDLANNQAQLVYDIHAAGVIVKLDEQPTDAPRHEDLVCHLAQNPTLPRQAYPFEQQQAPFLKRYLYHTVRDFLFGTPDARINRTSTEKSVQPGAANADPSSAEDGREPSPEESDTDGPAQEAIAFTNHVSRLLSARIKSLRLCVATGGGFEVLEPDSNVPANKLTNPSRQKCSTDIQRELRSGSVRDQARDFHRRPHRQTSVEIAPEAGRIITEINPVEERYRNRPRDIDTISQQLAVWSRQQDRFTQPFVATIACTNSRGTGRTCESHFTVEVVSMPDGCLYHFNTNQQTD